MGCWYATCHTVGDTIWVTRRQDADVLNRIEANELYYQYLKAGADVHLYEVPKTDARHPLRHYIPGVPKQYQLLRTVDNEWFARAVVDGITYETIPVRYASDAHREVSQGSMFDHMLNKEANEKNIKMVKPPEA